MYYNLYLTSVQANDKKVTKMAHAHSVALVRRSPCGLPHNCIALSSSRKQKSEISGRGTRWSLINMVQSPAGLPIFKETNNKYELSCQ